MISGFFAFIRRGNVIDLAIAVVIGTAFGTVVKALVSDLLTPLIAAIFGKPEFSALTLTLNNSKFLYGDFINAVIAFLCVAGAIYYAVIVPMNKVNELRGVVAPAAPVPCPECLSDIPPAAKRCRYCTAVLPAG